MQGNSMQNIKLFSTKFLDLIQTTFTDLKGNTKNWFWAQRPNSQNAVIIVAFVEDDYEQKLVIIKEFRVPLNNYEYGLPAGLIDPGQDIKDTAIRELKEETGLDVVEFLKEPSPIVYNSAGLTDEGCSIVYVEATGQLTKDNLQDSEDIETFLYSRVQISNLMNQARLDKNICIGAKAWMIFETFVEKL
jgi:ADP-ribose pyrophosphatase